MQQDTQRPSRTLTLAQKARIVAWLNESHEWLKGRPSYIDASRKCTKDTGLEMGHKTLKDIAEAFGLLWEPLISAGGMGNRKLRERVDKIETRLEVAEKQLRESALHADIMQLRESLASLYAQLGAKLPLPPKPIHNGVQTS
jgi:hypothetical protein